MYDLVDKKYPKKYIGNLFENACARHSLAVLYRANAKLNFTCARYTSFVQLTALPSSPKLALLQDR